MIQLVGYVAWPLMCGVVAALCFRGFEKYLEHREKKFTHEPLAKMQARLDDIETRLLTGAMRR